MSVYADICRLPDGREILCAAGLDLPDPRSYVHKGSWACALVQEPLSDGRWRELAPHGQQPAGDVGGDDQISEAYSRRFARQHADGSWAIYEVAFYVVTRREVGESAARTYVERQRYYAGCADPFDPGADERWPDYRYTEAGSGTTEADAIAACADLVAEAIGWDGTPEGIEAAERMSGRSKSPGGRVRHNDSLPYVGM